MDWAQRQRALAGGAKVVVSDIGDGTETASAVGGAYIKHDVTSEAGWVATIDFTKTTFGGLDILVNNTGIFWVRPISMTTLEAFRQMQQVNVEGVFLGLKHGIPAIAERAQKWDGGGSIVNISSVARPGGIFQHARLQRLKGGGAVDDQGSRYRVRRAETPRCGSVRSIPALSILP